MLRKSSHGYHKESNMQQVSKADVWDLFSETDNHLSPTRAPYNIAEKSSKFFAYDK